MECKVARSSKANINVERRAEIGQERRARTRKAILDAAFRLLGTENGLATRIEEIIKAANISRGTFYNYFTSIEELFAALSYELNHDFNDSVLSIVSQMPEASERVGAAVRYYLARAEQDPRWGWAMVNISAFGVIFGELTYRQALTTVEEGIASNEFELTGPISGRDMLLGTTLAAMRTMLTGPPSKTFPVSVARHILRGMGVPKDRTEQIVAMPLVDPMTVQPAAG